MHITIISECEKKAWPKTRAIVDSYAIRTGHRSWSTHITLEGLNELHSLIRSSATRFTAVACYKNSGNKRMKLAWTVGSKSKFGENGVMPVAFIGRKAANPPSYLREVALSAQSAGYLHDWGKSGLEFQDMLSSVIDASEVQYDTVRHEWISYRLIRGALEYGFDGAWNALRSPAAVEKIESLKKGVIDPQSALEYLVISHHKMLGERDDESINICGHKKGNVQHDGLKGKSPIKKELYEKAIHVADRRNNNLDAKAWQPISTMGRAALILADHYISSINYQEKYGKPKSDLFANTKGGRYGENQPARFDQPLEWHLESVGDKASDIARDMILQEYEGLSCDTLEKILEASSHPSFVWQDQSVRFINSLKIEEKSPQTLIINTAGTGAGKTRANAKFACSLNPSGRFCIGLNLRTLTLQTGDSLRNDLGLLDSELSVVIGDKVTEKLHKKSADAFSVDGDKDTDIDISGQRHVLPPWLKPLTSKGRGAELVMPPVLVSTIDFLINASEPGKQGHHALALIRSMNSDLILDELDSYDPDAMIAVLRLIQMFAMMGRHVICSSATISEPVAMAIHSAFVSGSDMFHAMKGEKRKSSTIMIDDLQQASQYDENDNFGEWVRGRHSKLFNELDKKPAYRMMQFLNPENLSSESISKSIISGIDILHENTAWKTGSGKNISFGLIRVANIKTAIYLSRELSRHFSESSRQVNICCYHSNEWRIKRFLKEKALDEILNRKGKWKEKTESHPEVKSSLQGEESDSLFIVIATPVEEVGRDHDFDWAIIEPSSAQSIVQTCGRVNRHRLDAINKPNVLLLDINFNAQRAGDTTKKKRKSVFTRPGLEPANTGTSSPSSLYSSFRISEMCPKNIDRIDARFRLGATQMGIDEDRIIERRLSGGMDILLKATGQEGSWITQYFYSRYPLRARSRKHLFRLFESDGSYQLQAMQNQKNSQSWINYPRSSVGADKNQWLSWTESELIEACAENGISIEDGMALDIIKYGEHDDRILIHDESFGFTMENS